MTGACMAEAPAVSGARPPRGGPVSVKRGFGWALSGYAVYMLCQWGMIMTLTRWGSADLKDVALFALALATTTPIVLFSNLGLRRVFATDATSTFRFQDYFGLRMATNIAALALIAGVVWARGDRTELVWATLAMGAAKMIESTSDILHGYFQERGRIDVGARASILRGLLSLAGFLAGFFLTRDVFWSIVGMGAGWAAALLVYEWPWTLRFLREEPDPSLHRSPSRRWLRLAILTLPLGLVALVTSLKASIPTFVIEHHLGETALGLFAALIYFHHGINRVVSSLGEAAASRLSTLHASGDGPGTGRLLVRMLGVALFISGAGVGVALVAGNPLLRVLYGSAYAGMGGLLVAIMAAATVANLQTVLDYAMVATRHLRVQPFLYGGGALLLLGFCVALVPPLGLPGAALALGIVSAAELLTAGGIVGWALLAGRVTRARPALEGP